MIPIQSKSKRLFSSKKLLSTDSLFSWICRLAAISVGLVILWIVFQVAWQAIPAIKAFGIEFIYTATWDPVNGIYGAFSQIVGTLISALLALTMAIPIALCTAIFLSEDFIPERLRSILSFFVELLAAIPSVIYGLWGIFVLIPILRIPANWLFENFGWFPLFGTRLSGPGLLPAAIVLAIMIIPIITALSRDVLVSQSSDYRQASYALGATRWETIAKVLLPNSARGISAAVMLGLGRAMGETMAVAMLIGNSANLSISIFAPWTTVSSHLANQFGEASGLQLSSLMYSALLLFAITLLVNILANFIIHRKTRSQ